MIGKGFPARALPTARAALAATDLHEELGAVFDLQRAGLAAGLAALEERRDEAMVGYQEAFRLARQLETDTILAELLLDAVHVLGPDDPETPGFAAEARALYQRAGARAYLDRLDEALRTAPDPARISLAGVDASPLGGAGH